MAADLTRVKLQPAVANTDYVNASWVPGYRCGAATTFANCRLTALLQGRPAVHRVAAPEQLHAGDLLAHGVADQDQDSHMSVRLPTAGQ